MEGTMTVRVSGTSSTEVEDETIRVSQEITDVTSQREATFHFMVLYRWLALAAALLLTFVLPHESGLAFPLLIAGIALMDTLAITLASRPLNRLLCRSPYLLSLDLVFVGGLLAATGGWRSPYYLYALSPILAAAFFFQWRGAFIAATLLAILFGAGLGWQWLWLGMLPTWEIALTYLIGFYLIGGLFSYPANLLRRLSQAHDHLRLRNADLSRAHQELQIIHDLATTMHSASDPSDVQEHLLKVLVERLGFPRAVIALNNPNSSSLSSWLSQNQVGGPSTPLPHLAHIPFETDSGILVKTLRQGRSQIIMNGSLPSDNPNLNEQLALGQFYAAFPLVLRHQSLGVVAVSLPDAGLTPGDMATLTSITDQAAVALGNVQLCIERTRRLTKEEERNRIAHEIHDTVLQSLFGFVYTLDSCVKLLPEHADVVKTRLVNLHPQALDLMYKVRQSIYDLWEADVTTDYFQNEMLRYVRQFCRANPPTLKISVDEGFEKLDPGLRQTFLRVAQESIANVVKHAQADQATVAIILAEDEATLVVADNGVGFVPDAVKLDPNQQQRQFGLVGMKERIGLLDGQLTINQRCDRGTVVMAKIPLKGGKH
jgi:signal transduction histidine kinase